jgi:hypothetical protein
MSSFCLAKYQVNTVFVDPKVSGVFLLAGVPDVRRKSGPSGPGWFVKSGPSEPHWVLEGRTFRAASLCESADVQSRAALRKSELSEPRRFAKARSFIAASLCGRAALQGRVSLDVEPGFSPGAHFRRASGRFSLHHRGPPTRATRPTSEHFHRNNRLRVTNNLY